MNDIISEEKSIWIYELLWKKRSSEKYNALLVEKEKCTEKYMVYLGLDEQGNNSEATFVAYLNAQSTSILQVCLSDHERCSMGGLWV